MKKFTKWFLLNAVVLTACFFAQTKDAFSTIINNDISKISILIISLYIICSGYIGYLCYRNEEIDKDYVKKRSEIGWFAAEHFFSLGLLGTIFGLCVATSESLNANISVPQIVSGLKSGLNTAFYTTICGIIFSLPLQVQLIILDFEEEVVVKKRRKKRAK